MGWIRSGFSVLKISMPTVLLSSRSVKATAKTEKSVFDAFEAMQVILSIVSVIGINDCFSVVRSRTQMERPFAVHSFIGGV